MMKEIKSEIKTELKKDAVSTELGARVFLLNRLSGGVFLS